MADNNELMLKNIFSYLLDSVSYVIDKKNNITESDTIHYNIDNAKNEIENMKNGIKNIMETYNKKTNYKNFQTYSDKINENASTNLDLFFAGIRAEWLMDIEKIELKIKTDNDNAIKNLCEFLRQNPFTVREKIIKINNSNGILHLMSDYKCTLDIEYTFSTELVDNEFFKAPYFASLGYSTSIPIKRDGDKIYYEDIAKYSLENMEIDDDKMIASFANNNGKNHIYFESRNFQDIAIKFDDGEQQVDITSILELNKDLDRESILNALKKLYEITKEVEDNKGELLHLTFQNRGILKDMDIDGFMEALLSTDYIKNVMKNIPDTSDDADQITREFIINRINTLGKEAERYKKILFG